MDSVEKHENGNEVYLFFFLQFNSSFVFQLVIDHMLALLFFQFFLNIFGVCLRNQHLLNFDEFSAELFNILHKPFGQVG